MTQPLYLPGRAPTSLGQSGSVIAVSVPSGKDCLGNAFWPPIQTALSLAPFTDTPETVVEVNLLRTTSEALLTAGGPAKGITKRFSRAQ